MTEFGGPEQRIQGRWIKWNREYAVVLLENVTVPPGKVAV